MFAEVGGGAAACLVRALSPRTGVRARHSQPSPRALLLRQERQDHAKNEEAPASTPQVGDNLWIAAQPRIERGRKASLEWAAHPRKAPRVQRIALFFAEDRVRRPSDRWSRFSRSPRKRSPGELRALVGGPAQAGRPASQAQAGSSGGFVKGSCALERNEPAMSASPAGTATSSRHEVSERIGSGRSFCRERS
jgi:hypothetical protein